MPVKTRLDEAVTLYRRYRMSQNLSKNTIGLDSITLQALMKATGTNLYMENLANHHVVNTMILLGQTNKPRSMANHFYNLQNFFKFCATIGKCMPRWHDPMEGMKVPNFTVTEKRRLPVQYFPKVLDSAPQPRDRILFASALYLLSRANELCDIRIGDINLNSGRIRVHVSKRRSRKAVDTDLMPITKEYDRELREWLMEYQRCLGYLDPSWYLLPALTRPVFVPGAGRPTFISGFSTGRSQELAPDRHIQKPHEIAARTLREINWLGENETGEGMHTFRRAGARARFDALRAIGYDGALRQVQALLHHAHGSMTEEYIGLTLDKLERDEALIGQDMYPQLNNPEVINLAEFRVDPYDPTRWETDLPGFKIRAS